MRILSVFLFFITSLSLAAQDSTTTYAWNVSSKKLDGGRYEIRFHTPGAAGWQLYTPNQTLSDLPAAVLRFSDSAIASTGAFNDSGGIKKLQSPIFDGTSVALHDGAATWRKTITVPAPVPATVQGTLQYYYGKGDEFYTGELPFAVALEGGVAASTRIVIPSIDVKNPVRDCGDAETGKSGLLKLFLIGLGAGLLSLFFPCIFPLIPLTVSFFTKRSGSRRRGIANAVWYGFSIALIYTLISLPFHIFNLQPEVLNSISTNVPLNLIFFAVFIVFAISFFGYFEIALPGNIASKADSRSGIGDFAGIFFMALTLAIVSFSCTGPILGSLLVGALNEEGGAWQLTTGMAGFGVGLGMPFVLFALFPGWLKSIPKSGGWMNELKVVFGFIELAMAVKFLSNADLVKQWHLLPREVFIGIWALIGLATVLYLAGVIRFPHDSKPKMTPVRWGFILLFSLITIYLIPGVTNTKAANLALISGFPPPLCYSVYAAPANCVHTIEPLKNDYEEALRRSKLFKKPILVDFTGWACVNCRRMEEKVWPDAEVARMMQNDFIVVSLYVDERKALPPTQQTEYAAKNGTKKSIITVGDLWSTFQAENFYAVAQPQYVIISPDEKALTRTKAYTPDPKEFRQWLQCGLEAYRQASGNE